MITTLKTLFDLPLHYLLLAFLQLVTIIDTANNKNNILVPKFLIFFIFVFLRL